MDLKNKQKTWGGAFLPERYTNGQQTCEKMFNTTDHCMKISVAEKYHFTPIRRATQINKQKRTRLGAGERPLWFRTLAALPEYPEFGSQTTLNRSKTLKILFEPLLVPH